MKTGYHVRAQRDAKFQALDIAELSDAEFDAFVKTQDNDPARGWMWAKALAAWVRDLHGELYGSHVSRKRLDEMSAMELAEKQPALLVRVSNRVRELTADRRLDEDISALCLLSGYIIGRYEKEKSE